jgi:hypothetical protein
MQFVSRVPGGVHFPGGLRLFLLGLTLPANRNPKDGGYARLRTLVAGKIRVGLHHRQAKHSWDFTTVCHRVIQ